MSVFMRGQFVEYNGLEVGWIEGDVFYSRRQSKMHYFRVFGGYALSQEVVDWLHYNDVRKIVLYVDEKIRLEATVDQFRRAEKYLHSSDQQRVLNALDFKASSLFDAPNENPQAMQRTL